LTAQPENSSPSAAFELLCCDRLIDRSHFFPRAAKEILAIIDNQGEYLWLLLSIGNYQRALLNGQSPTSATLVKRRDGSYYIQICVDLPTQPPNKTPKVIGVDLGRRSIAATSTGKTWHGERLNRIRDRYSRVRANVQVKRTRSSRRLLKRLSGRERRFHKWLNNNISKQLIAEAKQLNAALAFEDLTKIGQSLNKKPRSKTEVRAKARSSR
jgi:putative transposase